MALQQQKKLRITLDFSLKIDDSALTLSPNADEESITIQRLQRLLLAKLLQGSDTNLQQVILGFVCELLSSKDTQDWQNLLVRDGDDLEGTLLPTLNTLDEEDRHTIADWLSEDIRASYPFLEPFWSCFQFTQNGVTSEWIS